MAKTKKQKKQGKKPKPAIIAVAIIVLALLAFFVVQQRQPAEEPEEKPIAKKGDLVTINYVLTMDNGSVIDTNNVKLAKEFGLKNYPTGPYTFILGQSGKVKGFDKAIIGMQEGEHRIITIEPSEQVGMMVMNRTAIVPRNFQIPRFTVVTIKSYEENFNKPPVIDDTAYNPEKFPWAFRVVNMTEKRVGLEHLVDEGKSYQLPGNPWNSTLLAKSSRALSFRHNPVEGQTVETPIGTATVSLDVGRFNLTLEPVLGAVLNRSLAPFGLKTKQEFMVVNYTDTNVFLRRINHPAQERLFLDVTLLSVEPTTKSV